MSGSENERSLESHGEHRWREWILLDGNRFVIAVAITAGAAALYFALEVTGVAPLSTAQPLFYVFSGLIAGNVTLITVVVSINQLLLSRELKAPNELRSQIDGVVDYRRKVETVTDRTAPAEPSEFLRLVIEAARRDAQRLGAIVRRELDGDEFEEVDDVVRSLTDHFDHVDELVRSSDPGVFNVLSTTLETNYAYEVRRIEEFRRAHDDRLSETATDAIESLLDRLKEFDVARQYFKSVYLQVELSSLSRYLFYAGIPAVVASVGALFLFTGPGVTVLSMGAQLVVFPLAIGLGVLPVSILFTFILRTATVTERTAAITPFTTPDQES